MNKERTDLEIIESFIYDEEVEKLLCRIENNLMDLNIFEITGMGDQEIKHSNIIGWLLEQDNHQILKKFLEKISEDQKNKDFETFESLKTFLPNIAESKFIIHREKHNIDILLDDQQKEVVIVIENKLFAGERTEGDDGGQLKKYETYINKQYGHYKYKYFIFLTIDGTYAQGGDAEWMIATHQMMGDAVEEVLKNPMLNDEKQKLVLSSYVDLLKKRGLMMDKELIEKCKDIWKIHHNALDILMQTQPGMTDYIREVKDEICQKFGDREEKIFIPTQSKAETEFYICTDNWVNQYPEFKKAENKLEYIRNHTVAVGIYFTKKYIQVWLHRPNMDEKYKRLYGKIKNKNKDKDIEKDKTTISVLKNFETINYPIYEREDRVKKDIIEELLKIDECFVN